MTEGLDLQVLVCRNHIDAVLEEEKHALVFLHRIVPEEEKHIRGLEEVFHNHAVASEARVVVHLLGGLWEVEEGVSSIVEVGVDCIAVDYIAGSWRKRGYCSVSATHT